MLQNQSQRLIKINEVVNLEVDKKTGFILMTWSDFILCQFYGLTFQRAL